MKCWTRVKVLLFICSHFCNFVCVCARVHKWVLSVLQKWKCKKSASLKIDDCFRKALSFSRGTIAPYRHFREYGNSKWMGKHIHEYMTIPLLIMWLWTRIWLFTYVYAVYERVLLICNSAAWCGVRCGCRCISFHCLACWTKVLLPVSGTHNCGSRLFYGMFYFAWVSATNNSIHSRARTISLSKTLSFTYEFTKFSQKFSV